MKKELWFNYLLVLLEEIVLASVCEQAFLTVDGMHTCVRAMKN